MKHRTLKKRVQREQSEADLYWRRYDDRHNWALSEVRGDAWIFDAGPPLPGWSRECTVPA